MKTARTQASRKIKTTHTHKLITPALVGAVAFGPNVIQAGEPGHFNPGVMNIRDYVVPDPGFYGVLYNYWYETGEYKDQNGNSVSSINVGPGAGVKVNINAEVNMYAVSPVLIWVSDWKIAGAKYGAFIAPSFANTSLGAALSTERAGGLTANTSSFGAGDMLVQPLWLGWTLTNWDFALGYGFWAPVGKYDLATVTLPVIGPVKTTSPNNIGLGFWEQQVQGAVSWYPWSDKRMAVATALTWGIPQQKQGFNLTPGQNLTLNWGVSEYLPLKKDQTLLLEVGPAGYDSWQITYASGSAASYPGTLNQVHAVGGQLGVTCVPWVTSVNFHAFYEYEAQERFQGVSFGLNFAKKF